MTGTVDVRNGLELVNVKIFKIHRSAEIVQISSHLAGTVCKSLVEAGT